MNINEGLLKQGGRNCLHCDTPLPGDANFCSNCGFAQPGAADAGNVETSEAPKRAETFGAAFRDGLMGKSPDPKSTPSRRYGALFWLAVIAAVVLFKLGVLDDPLRWAASELAFSPLEMSVEIRSHSEAPNAKFGYITITNLSNQTVTLQKVAVNHRKDAVCVFGSGGTEFGASSVLEQGHNITLATVGLLLGGCGSIFVVTIDTDKGSGDFKIDWR